MDDTKRENHELTWAKERLDKELEKLRIELDDVRAHLNSAEDERVCAVEEVKAIQLLMAKKMESEVRERGTLQCVCVWWGWGVRGCEEVKAIQPRRWSLRYVRERGTRYIGRKGWGRLSEEGKVNYEDESTESLI